MRTLLIAVSLLAPAAAGDIGDAAGLGKLEAFKRALAEGGDVNRTSEDGTTVLHLAVVGGNAEIVRLLIARQVKLDAVDLTFGYAPLHIAARFGRIGIARLLIEAGARTDLVTLRDGSALDVAIKYDQPGMQALLRGKQVKSARADADERAVALASTAHATRRRAARALAKEASVGEVLDMAVAGGRQWEYHVAPVFRMMGRRAEPGLLEAARGNDLLRTCYAVYALGSLPGITRERVAIWVQALDQQNAAEYAARALRDNARRTGALLSGKRDRPLREKLLAALTRRMVGPRDVQARDAAQTLALLGPLEKGARTRLRQWAQGRDGARRLWGHLALRHDPGRLRRRDPTVERMIRRGIVWLLAQQTAEGYWRTYFKNGEIGVTALALHACLGPAGVSGIQGDDPQACAIRRGIEWLARTQNQFGQFVGKKPDPRWVYGQALATCVLAQAYARTGDPVYRRPLVMAVDRIQRMATPGGGWGYGRSRRVDSSVTVMMVRALAAAWEAGVRVDAGAFVGATRCIERLTDSRGGVGYDRPGGYAKRYVGERESRRLSPGGGAAAGLLVCLLAGQDKRQASIRMGTALNLVYLPWSRDTDYIHFWIGSEALFESGTGRASRWFGAGRRGAAKAQQKDGSWPATGFWTEEGGPTCSTAAAILGLQARLR